MTQHAVTKLQAILFLLLLGFAPALLAQGKKGSQAGSLRFTKASFNVAEDVGEAVITVRRHQGTKGEVSVSYATSDGSAVDPDDYHETSGVLTWPDGDDSQRSFTVEIVDDDEGEGLETVVLTLSNATGGATLDKAPTQASLKILPSDNGGDDDGEDGEDGEDDVPEEGLLRFDQRTYQTHEGASAAVITVRREGGSVGEVSVAYTTEDASAVAPDDYEETSGTLTWEDGDSELKTFDVPLVDDGAEEPTEKIGLLLSDPTGGAALDEDFSTASIILHDNDQPGTGGRSQGVIGFRGVEFQVVEDDTDAVVVLERRYGKQGVVSVDFETVDDSSSATEGEDYEGVIQTVTWARGDARPKTVRIPIIADDAEEGTETVEMRLSNVRGGAALDPDAMDATLMILDDDSSQTSCIPDGDTMCFQGGRFAVEVVWRAGHGAVGNGHAVPISDGSGAFWFFQEENTEMLVKVLDGCSVAGLRGFWVFSAATTNLDFTLQVTDTATGLTKSYDNLGGQAAKPVQDLSTFDSCSP